MADLRERSYTFEFSFGGDQIEHVSGGMIVHGAQLHMPKRQYRHSNPTRKKRRDVPRHTLRQWRSV